jgi:ethanolamine-phosphate cytidylyltransferase
MSEKKAAQVRLWADGCFDMMHFGHANSLRQAKSLGDYLIVGVHSDADIATHKGPPVMSEEERYEAVEACKWVDEVYRAAPYTTSLTVMNEVKADFCVHGDDLVTDANGEDCYIHVKREGRFKTIPRTEGVSTTALVGRMLLLTNEDKPAEKSESSKQEAPSPYTVGSAFLPSTRRLVQFASTREPKAGEKIGYVTGAFDVFHIGHIRFLKKARAECDYLIVGVQDDAVVRHQKKGNWPVMTVYERLLSVLSCRYVDEIIIGAPAEVTEQILKQYKVNIVLAGTVVDPSYKEDRADPFVLAKKQGIFKQIESPSSLTTSDIVARIMKQRAAFEERNKKKEAKEIKEFGKLLHT